TGTDMRRRRHERGAEADGLAIRALHDVRTGRFERSLSALTAAGAVITTAEIASVFSAKAAHTVLPLASAAIVINGVQGTYLHLRGVAQRPGGITRYNLEAGPPVFAPLLASLVGGMGLLAAVLRREGQHQHGAKAADR